MKTSRAARHGGLLLAALVLSMACAPRTAEISDSQKPVDRAPRPDRLLTISVPFEVTSPHPTWNRQGGADATLLMFTASLAVTDDRQAIRPVLAAELPQLNTATWQVLPDGRMDTSYKLRPGLTWHDGAPLEADDFAFAKRVYSNPNVGVSRPRAERLMDSVDAPDPHTLIIRWASPYPFANHLVMGDLDPLPRHLLEQPFANLERNPAESESFSNLAYWRSDYVGAGPYRLVQWEPGSHFEATAFAGYALGRPKIDRVIMKVFRDDNVNLTNVLAGTLDWGQVLFEQHLVLQRDWVPSGKGSLALTVGNPQPWLIQQKPEYVGHAALLDVRVRRALAIPWTGLQLTRALLKGRA